MKRKYETEEDVLAIVSSFEDGTISRDNWKHAEHLTVALYYLSKHDTDTATNKMRSGIFNLLRSFGVDLEKEMPYHETLTVFWMRTLTVFNVSKNGSSIVNKANELVGRFDKDYPLKFYTREFLFSDEARAMFVEGDL
ncbi:MAG: hypothetical protein WKF92_00225 [Pyrinomonadaceae bacterium]